MDFAVAYPAQIQVDRLSPAERDELETLFSSANPGAAQTKRPVSDGRFVSKVGSKHVLWHVTETGTPEILSVLDPSYAA